ncbi:MULTISPECIES: hypothetical protein [Bacteroides]|jgi:hypothetical protein|uniref:Uncharacterized protein n=1 Tax=Bacteroides clarus TaxID=626929 RepID=A0A1Y4JXF6_9BACE|nr:MULTISPECIES: hypothetical protein [Bacteroides]OUP35469.1 hypothetical protein B5F24_05770 [Bacteroides clarus]
MKTLNVNETKMVNNSVESNNATMGNVEELTKVLNQEEKELQRLTKRNANEAVIAAQKNVVDNAKAKLEQAQEFERISKEKAVNSFFTFSVVDEETGVRTEQQKKIAFVKNNRPVNSKKVDGFIALIAANKYDKAFPIIVMEASKLIEAGYTVTDINGKELTKEEAKDYFVILDGQHRSTAFAKLIATGEYQNLIPNVHVRDIENVGEYLVDINNVGSSWDKRDKLVVASLTTKDELFQNVAELLNEGFNPSTAMLIYTGKSLPDKQVNKALKGEKIIFPKGVEINIERGNKFINLCKAANMSVSFITKRYFIKDFNSYAKSTSEEQAFEALNKLKELNYTETNWKDIKEEDDFIEILKEALEA